MTRPGTNDDFLTHRRWPLSPHRGRLPYTQYAGHFGRLSLDWAASFGVLLLWLAVGHPGVSRQASVFLFEMFAPWSAFLFGGYAAGFFAAQRREKMLVTRHKPVDGDIDTSI